MLKLLRIFGFIAKHFDLGNWLAKSALKLFIPDFPFNYFVGARLSLVFWAIYCWCNHQQVYAFNNERIALHQSQPRPVSV